MTADFVSTAPSNYLTTHFTDAGVPLRSTATNFCAFACGRIIPFLVIAWTMKIPHIGMMTILTAATESIAAHGRRESGRGILSRAKDTPSRMRAKGTMIPPRNDAVEYESMS